jgi:hypothetical protein
MKSKFLVIAALAATLCGALPLHAADKSVAVVGEKLDSGLGSLPHYSRWADRSGRVVIRVTAVPGESLDDGLGELPHYRLWVDRSGKHPMGQPVRVASN